MDRKKYVIIMAAGSGSRMGADRPKQFLELGGKAVLHRTIEVFLEAVPGITVVTVLPEQHIEYWKEYCYKKNFTCPQILIKGGMTRFHSVKNALDRIPQGALVGVHDGVRPLITADLVSRLYSMAEKHPALIPVTPCVETLKVLVQKDGRLEAVPGAQADRSSVRRPLRCSGPNFLRTPIVRRMIQPSQMTPQWWKGTEKAFPT